MGYSAFLIFTTNTIDKGVSEERLTPFPTRGRKPGAASLILVADAAPVKRSKAQNLPTPLNTSAEDQTLLKQVARSLRFMDVNSTTACASGTPMHLYLPGPHQGVFNIEALSAS